MIRAFALISALALSACDAPNFIADAPVVAQTSVTPDHFELPARFALVRTVYGFAAPAGAREAELWSGLAERASSMGTFLPLVHRGSHHDALMEAARAQRFNYVLMISHRPEIGSAEITLYDAASGGLMATATAVSEGGGVRPLLGWRVRNPARLERVTYRIAEAALPEVEELLQGVIDRAQ